MMMVHFGLGAFTELLMGNIHKTTSSPQHIITNKNDAIIAVCGYIRHCIHQLIQQLNDHRNYKDSIFNLLRDIGLITNSSLISYDSVPLPIINLIIQFYYFNESEQSEMDEPKLTLASLRVGGKIDAKDDWEKYYGATILYIKPACNEFPINNNIQRLSVSPGIKYLYPNDWKHDMGLFIHYNGCSSRYDEWIFVKPHTICDCNDICHYKDLHFIAKHGTQSKQVGLAQFPQFGIPKIKNSVGMANLSNSSWLNCILQALYATPQIYQFIMSGKYLSNELQHKTGTHAKKQYQHFLKRHPLLIRLHDLFANITSNEFSVVSPYHVYEAVMNGTSKPREFEQEILGNDKPFVFLSWILDKFAAEYAVIDSVFQGRYQIQYKALPDSPPTHVMKAAKNKKRSQWLRTSPASMRYGQHSDEQQYECIPNAQSRFLSLDLPIINGMTRQFVIDVYDARDITAKARGHGLQPPTRHRIVLPRDGKVADLEALINLMYDVQSGTQSTFFYRLWGFRCCYVWNSFEPLTDVDDEVACYIIEDWSPTNHICHVHHVRPIEKPELDELDNSQTGSLQHDRHGNIVPNVQMQDEEAHLIHDNYPMETDSDSDTDTDDDESTFELETDEMEEVQEDDDDDDDDDVPDDSKEREEYEQQRECKHAMEVDGGVSHVLRHHYRHHHEPVHMNDKHVVSPFAFGMPFIVSLPHTNTTGRSVHKLIYQRLYAWIGDDEILPRPPRILHGDEVDEQNESEWDVLFISLPYTLRWVHKDYNFYFDGFKPPIVTADEVPINYTWNYHANIVVEWNHDTYEIVRPLFNKLENREFELNGNINPNKSDPQNTECANLKIQIPTKPNRRNSVHDPDMMTIYDCIDEFMRNKLEEHSHSNHIDKEPQDNDDDGDVVVDERTKRSECQPENQQLKLWALPEVLVLHLPRFYKFTVERLNKSMTRNGYIPSMIQYPIYDLDLSRYMAEELTMNARYDLYAVVCHSGTNHFYTLCRNENDQWLKYEDSKVTKICESTVVNNKAIILFYKQTKQNSRLATHSLFNTYF